MPKLAVALRRILGAAALAVLALFGAVSSLFAIGLYGCAPATKPTDTAVSDPHAPARGTVVAQRRSPLEIAIAPSAEEASFEGSVTERLEAGSYLYFAVAADDGATRWVTTLRTTEASVGDRVSARSFAVRENFHSNRTGRDFDRLHFGIVRRASSNRAG